MTILSISAYDMPEHVRDRLALLEETLDDLLPSSLYCEFGYSDIYGADWTEFVIKNHDADCVTRIVLMQFELPDAYLTSDEATIELARTMASYVTEHYCQ